MTHPPVDQGCRVSHTSSRSIASRIFCSAPPQSRRTADMTKRKSLIAIKPRAIMAAGMSLAVVSLGGCGASLPGISTGSLFGGSAASTAAPAAPVITNDPTSRAVQVGRTAARAQKCGFNFDQTKLRTQFLASESASLPTAADSDRLAQSYDASYRGVARAINAQGEDFCTTQKSQTIKTALTRHLAGDYTPSPPEPVIEDDGGLFGGFGSSADNSENVDKLRHPPVGDY